VLGFHLYCSTKTHVLGVIRLLLVPHFFVRGLSDIIHKKQKLQTEQKLLGKLLLLTSSDLCCSNHHFVAFILLSDPAIPTLFLFWLIGKFHAWFHFHVAA
jgi:uncharacterized membrane protein